MKKKNIFFILLVVIAVSIFSVEQQQVGVDQLGVRSFLGKIQVFQAGESVLVLPFVSHFVKMTANPVLFKMAGENAINLTVSAKETKTVDCVVRYQIENPAAFIDKLGMVNVQNQIETIIRNKTKEAMMSGSNGGIVDFNSPPDRMLMTAQLLHTLNSDELTPGIKILSFELLNW